jgi:hypothetical protein
MRTVQAIGWDWTAQGVIVTLVVDGDLMQWLVPIGHVHVQFSREMQRVGCPLPPSVGAPSVGGLFSSISHAVSSAAKSVKKAVPSAISKATSSVAKLAEQGAKQVSRQAKHYGRQAYGIAKRTIRDPKQLALAGMTGGLSLMAQADVHRDLLGAAKYIPGPIGTAASTGLAGGKQLANLAQGKRVNLGELASGLAQAGVNYVPGGAALTATPLGRTALSTGLALAKGKRVDKALKSALLKEANIPGLAKLLPSSSALNQAHKAWGLVTHGHEAAKRLSRGIPGGLDRKRLQHGAAGLQAIRRTVQQARRGNRRARELVSAFHRVGACL